MNISLGEGGYDFLDDPTIPRIGDTKDKDEGTVKKKFTRTHPFPIYLQNG